MPAEQIAHNLAYINWTVLTGLAFGALAAGVVGRSRTEAPRGYLAFTALCAAAFAGLAYLSDVALPLVSFRHRYAFPDGQVLHSDSTLRFRSRDEMEATRSMSSCPRAPAAIR